MVKARKTSKFCNIYTDKNRYSNAWSNFHANRRSDNDDKETWQLHKHTHIYIHTYKHLTMHTTLKHKAWIWGVATLLATLRVKQRYLLSIRHRWPAVDRPAPHQATWKHLWYWVAQELQRYTQQQSAYSSQHKLRHNLEQSITHDSCSKFSEILRPDLQKILWLCLQCFDTVGWVSGRASGL